MGSSIYADTMRCCQPARPPRAGEVCENDKMATFTSDVYVLQGDTEMRCKVLVVSYEQETDTRTVKTADPGPGGDRQIRTSNPPH